MKISHVHCQVRELPAAVAWFRETADLSPSFASERLAVFEFGAFTLILDAGAADSVVTVGFDSADCDADFAAMVLANYMFGGSITARMPDRIRNKEGLSYGASSRFTAPADGNGALFYASVSCNPVNMPKVEASFVDELKKTLRDGFTQAEVDSAKKAYADSRKVARSQETALVGLIASHEQLARTLLYDEQQEAKIQGLTLAQINAAFRKYMDPAAVTIVKAGDFKKVGVYQ